ncbi:MAG TPA: hypothetical protein DCF44_03910 [Chitinophagaceae bacterium]|nr:hypothetical protein [Chitinophagaceae bacterium]
MARGDLEFWSEAEKLQMTAAWDSQNAFRRRRKGGRAMAVTMRFAQKVRRQKFLKTFIAVCPCRSVKSCCAVARLSCRLSNRNAFCLRGIVYGELSAPIGGNVWRLMAVGLSKHQLSFTYKCFYRRYKFISEPHNIFTKWQNVCARAMTLRPPHWANLLL